MSLFSISNRKIDPSRRRPSATTRPDGSPAVNDRAEIGPTDIAFAEWEALGLTAPNLERMRSTRHRRIVEKLREHDYGGVLCFDPLNIRYATDSMNMQVWTMHNPSRAVFIGADGCMVLWDFHGCGHLTEHLPLLDEVRQGGAGFFYFAAGDKEDDVARAFATQVDELLHAHGGDNRRLAVDKIELPGVRALDSRGIEVVSGMPLMEHARVIKGTDEINAMRCSIATAEIAIAAMRDELRPGLAETELWAILHAENIARGGEWIETRILNSGPRTNPWMQEAGPRIIEPGDLVAFDTDMIGPYGMCADISRTWFCGEDEPTAEQKKLHAVALEHISMNMELLEPGVTFTELSSRGHQLPAEFVDQRYSVKFHGVGLCDEFPGIPYSQDFVPGALDYVLEPRMALCVEAYVGAVGGREGVKLEEQVVITDTGHEKLSSAPFDEKLMG